MWLVEDRRQGMDHIFIFSEPGQRVFLCRKRMERLGFGGNWVEKWAKSAPKSGPESLRTRVSS